MSAPDDSFLQIGLGNSPLVLGLPHTGTDIPAHIAQAYNPRGHAAADTDWHIHTVYDGLVDDITAVRTTVSRYVIDVNRDPSGQSLYPGQNTTTLCPIIDFDGHDIYRQGHEPTDSQIAQRRDAYHAPYHAALRAQLNRVKAIHGFAVLYDCHSIRSHIPFLFEGTLPDFNIGTNHGQTCDRAIERSVHEMCAAAPGYSSVLNGRFKGGWTTRHYGQPLDGVHAIQMELAQSTYMHQAPPWTYDGQKAGALRVHLHAILSFLSNWRPA